MVMACIAVAAGARAAVCTTPVASLIRLVRPARYASGDKASLPYASAVQTEWNPSDSARRT